MSTPLTPDVIQIQIVAEAKDAIVTFQNLGKNVQTLEVLVKGLATSIDESSKRWGVDVDVVKEKYAQLAEQLKVFGTFGAKSGMKEVSAELDDMAAAEKEATIQGNSLFSTTNVLRTAFGTLEAMAIFQVIQAISQVFGDATKNATEYYQAIQNITVAQDTLASKGVATTNQGLIDMAGQLHDKFQTFAQTDMLNATSQAALLTSNLGLSVQQIQRLVEMASTLARLHGGMPADYVDNLLKAASGTNALWANQMGIAATAEDIMAKAKELGLVAQDFTGKLSDQQKALAGLALEWDRLGPQEQKVLQDNNSELAQAAKATALWKDATTALGKEILPMFNTVKGLAGDLVGGISLIVGALQKLGAELAAVAIAWNAFYHNQDLLIHHWSETWKMATDLAMAELQKLQEGNMNMTNTPVNPAGATTPTAPGATVQQSDLNSVLSAYQSYYDSMEKAAQSFNNKMQDLQDQYNLRVQNEINNTNLRILQTEQDYNLKRQNEARNFQQKMKDMQDQYLLDLEGALRKRDAEAVINIIERYKNQVTEAKAQEQIQTQNQAAEEKLRIEQMKQDEKLRLQQMAAEYQLQRAQATRDYAQQKADLAKALDEKLQEEAVKLADKYNLNQDAAQHLYDLFNQYYGPNGELVNKQQSGYLAMEKNTATMIATMQGYVQTYGQVMSSMAAYSTLGINAQGGVGNIPYGPPTPPGYGGTGGSSSQGGIVPYGGGIVPYGGGGGITPVPGSNQGGGSSSNIRYGTGGVSLANSATTATYGESGPELAVFLPLNQSSNQVQGLSNVLGALGGARGGSAQIEVSLSPDLEARVINNTLNVAAISIKRVYGSR